MLGWITGRIGLACFKAKGVTKDNMPRVCVCISRPSLSRLSPKNIVNIFLLSSMTRV